MENEERLTCYNCENEINREEETYYTTYDGDIICEDCYDDHYFTCEDCNEIFHNDNGRYLERYDKWVCDNCMDDYNYCEPCGNYYREDDGHWVDGEFLCDDCYERYCDNVIKSYHDRDIGIHFKYVDKDLEDKSIYPNETCEKTPENMLKMGMEIEVENREDRISNDEMALKIREKYPTLELVFEEDGSLNNGFEIITQPMTMNYIREHEEDFRDICNMLSEYGFVSHNQGHCGQHIHFSRNFFSDDDDKYVGKLLTFFERYKNEIYRFSRREGTRWCAWVSDCANYDSKYYKSSKILCDYAKNNTGHGVAINLEHPETIEIRVFRGTLRFETLMSNFEFVNALAHIIKEVQIRKICFDKIIEYKGNKYIQDYCHSKNIFNSEFMSDETSNIFKAMQKDKDKYEGAKKDVRENLTTYISDMVNLTKELIATTPTLSKENEETIKNLFETTTKLQRLVSTNISFVNGDTLKENNEKVEDNYTRYIGYYGNNFNINAIIEYLVNIADGLPINDYTNNLRDSINNKIKELREKYANTVGGEI